MGSKGNLSVIANFCESAEVPADITVCVTLKPKNVSFSGLLCEHFELTQNLQVLG
jgi:hypothetical protein